jgi:hypothetical protein
MKPLNFADWLLKAEAECGALVRCGGVLRGLGTLRGTWSLGVLRLAEWLVRCEDFECT